ncbi:MAG: hypothetical protein C7B43_19480 [Sulfobacillus benefaciens]|uniref:HTH merR-type domain-containing protein n=1 Tax=Sulfobacillus benefaciens TaxID=453960 RepID=A0A2T2WPU8_9FIRM|nr:MAG: hypothetical protein C7B43_19480 [Sulfobacillus benefaciens]HBQ96568.1 hypothetical protein [Sulfobacillus sp.]
MQESATRIGIGDFAHACGVTPRTIRFYEERGLLPSQDRKERMNRSYSADLVKRVERIQQLQSLLGWSLEDIRQVLVLEDQVATLRQQYYQTDSLQDRYHVLQEAIDLTTEQLQRVNQRMKGLVKLQKDLEDKLAFYQTLRDDKKFSSARDGAEQ